MSELDTLFGLAEVAIGMAGFSAIVVLFKRRDTGRWQAADADRFNGMLIHALAAAFFCVLPAFLAVLIASPALLWRIASAAIGLQIALHTAVILRAPTTAGWARAVVLSGGLVTLAILAFNAAGLSHVRGFAPYLVGVLWHLLHAGTLFVMLIWVRSEDVES